jgi:hypothetical protein
MSEQMVDISHSFEKKKSRDDTDSIFAMHLPAERVAPRRKTSCHVLCE